MKLLIILGAISLISYAVYFVFKKNKRRAIIVSLAVFAVLVGLLINTIKRGERAPDIWCTTTHQTSSYPPENLKTAMDYFEKANYEFDSGKCPEAIADYTKSIELNPEYPQSYNNRAYTYMRMRDYKSALTDLNTAISLDPNYVNALMNRGDIHNYYFEIDRPSAVADYEKVVALAGLNHGSVCGHLFLARYNGWHLSTLLRFPLMAVTCS